MSDIKFTNKTEQIAEVIKYINAAGKYVEERERSTDGSAEYLPQFIKEGGGYYKCLKKNWDHATNELKKLVEAAEEADVSISDINWWLEQATDEELGGVHYPDNVLAWVNIGEPQEQMSGIKGSVNGKSGDVWEMLTEGLSKDDVAKITHKIDYYWDGASDYIAVNMEYDNWYAVVNEERFEEVMDEELDRKLGEADEGEEADEPEPEVKPDSDRQKYEDMLMGKRGKWSAALAAITPFYDDESYEVDTWFERDRSYIGLKRKADEATVIDVWDNDAQELIEDGFYNPSNDVGSMVEYAKHLGMIKPASERPKGEPKPEGTMDTATSSTRATAEYTQKDWKMAEDHLKKWSLEELREWGREAGLDADEMDKNDLIEVFLDHNGQSLIDELREEKKSKASMVTADKSLSWAGHVKLEQADEDVYDLYLNESFITKVKVGTPLADGLETMLYTDLSEDHQVVEKKWQGRITFKQTMAEGKGTPMFQMMMDNLPIFQFTSSAPAGVELGELFGVDLTSEVAPDYKKGADEWEQGRQARRENNTEKRLKGEPAWQMKEETKKKKKEAGSAADTLQTADPIPEEDSSMFFSSDEWNAMHAEVNTAREALHNLANSILRKYNTATNGSPERKHLDEALDKVTEMHDHLTDVLTKDLNFAKDKAEKADKAKKDKAKAMLLAAGIKVDNGQVADEDVEAAVKVLAKDEDEVNPHLEKIAELLEGATFTILKKINDLNDKDDEIEVKQLDESIKSGWAGFSAAMRCNSTNPGITGGDDIWNLQFFIDELDQGRIESPDIDADEISDLAEKAEEWQNQQDDGDEDEDEDHDDQESHEDHEDSLIREEHEHEYSPSSDRQVYEDKLKGKPEPIGSKLKRLAAAGLLKDGKVKKQDLARALRVLAGDAAITVKEIRFTPNKKLDADRIDKLYQNGGMLAGDKADFTFDHCELDKGNELVFTNVSMKTGGDFKNEDDLENQFTEELVPAIDSVKEEFGSGWKVSAAMDTKEVEKLKKKVEKITEGDYDLYEGYSGRGMVGERSSFAFQCDIDPMSTEGGKLRGLGLRSDNLGHRYIYYTTAAARKNYTVECPECGARMEGVDARNSRGKFQTENWVCTKCEDGSISEETRLEATKKGVLDRKGNWAKDTPERRGLDMMVKSAADSEKWRPTAEDLYDFANNDAGLYDDMQRVTNRRTAEEVAQIIVDAYNESTKDTEYRQYKGSVADVTEWVYSMEVLSQTPDEADEQAVEDAEAMYAQLVDAGLVHGLKVKKSDLDKVLKMLAKGPSEADGEDVVPVS